MEHSRKIRTFVLSLVIPMLAVCLNTSAGLFCVYAEDSGTDGAVVYDAADFASHNGRTKAEVKQKYTEARAEGITYINRNSDSYYEEPASTEPPYAVGVLSSDTLAAMRGMSNFYRWLIGVEPLTTNTENDESLQAQALDRNYQFDHIISNSSKPADMDQSLWDKGYPIDHNILALTYAPADAITQWLNEGYFAYTGKWNTVGHRMAILSADYSSISYGFSGYVAIGRCGSRSNTFKNAFASFPSAGPMPADLVHGDEASWTVELNPAYVNASDEDRVAITVENLTTGESYTCTKANNKAIITSDLLNFRQPTVADDENYTDSYKVSATGLTDVSTGKEASIVYTVEFFDLSSITSAELPRTKYAYTGGSIEPEVTVTDGTKTLTKGSDYEVIYHNNTDEGNAIVEVRGTGTYCGVIKEAFRIEKDHKDISQCDISFEQNPCYYNGSEQKPAVKVESFGKTLEEGKDYELHYSNNISVGEASVLVSGIGEFSGSVTKQFTIDKGLNNLTHYSISANTIEVGDTAVITATAGDNAQITYKSMDESIATVDNNGIVHGISEGQAYIMVISSETDNYFQYVGYLSVQVSKDIHTMVDETVIYADENNDLATVVRKCAICGREETAIIKPVSKFWLWYWYPNGYGYGGIDANQTVGNTYDVTMGAYEPEDADDTSIVLESSDPEIMTTDCNTFTFVGTGEVTLKIYAKYRPSTFITHTFNVMDEKGQGGSLAPTDSGSGSQTPQDNQGGGTTVTDPDNDNGHTSEDQGNDGQQGDSSSPAINGPDSENMSNDPAADHVDQTGADGTALGEGASAEAAEAAIAGMTSDKDLSGTVFSKLQLRSKKQTKTTIKLSWKKVSGAKSYVIYGNKCGKSNIMQKLVTSKGQSKTIKKILGKKLKKGTYYKFMIIALDNKNRVVSSSKIVHVATKGGKVGNVGKVTTKAKKSKVTIKKGKKFKLAGKQVAASKKLKVKLHRPVTYESTNPKIAKVSKKGVITGKKKGTCYVYAYAQNGVFAKIKVTIR